MFRPGHTVYLNRCLHYLLVYYMVPFNVATYMPERCFAINKSLIIVNWICCVVNQKFTVQPQRCNFGRQVIKIGIQLYILRHHDMRSRWVGGVWGKGGGYFNVIVVQMCEQVFWNLSHTYTCPLKKTTHSFSRSSKMLTYSYTAL